jgi:pimeloyl-ACP methyl ester carboxylesterase
MKYVWLSGKNILLSVILCSIALLSRAQLTDSVRCSDDPTQSYALYIPPAGMKVALPVVYFFDPHGSGILPVRKYKALADAYGFILVGSNNSRNGNDWPTTETIWQRLAADTRSRLKMDSRRVYTVGFSGGAKVASYIAIQHPGITGVIAGGAGLPDGVPAGDFSFTFTAIAGQGDMNLTELVGINDALEKTRTRHRLILFDGKHEWAPVNTMGLAFAGLQFDAMRARLIFSDNQVITTYIAGSKKRLRAYQLTSQLIKAAQECNLSIADLDGLSRQVAWFRQQAAALATNPEYLSQRQGQQDLLAREQNIKAEYMQHFQQADDSYWTSTIHDLDTKSVGHTGEAQMYQRLLAYLSLAFYSISNQMITGNDNANARHFVELYKLADPTNSEAWYFSAILNAREGKGHEAENDLLKADSYGFRDKARLAQQTEFQGLDRDKIEKGMHP